MTMTRPPDQPDRSYLEQARAKYAHLLDDDPPTDDGPPSLVMPPMPPMPSTPKGGIESAPVWADLLQWKTKEGRRTGLRNTLFNLQTILFCDPRWNCLGWDEAAQAAAWVDHPPFPLGGYADPTEFRLPRLITQADYTRCRIWFEEYALLSAKPADLSATIDVVAGHRSYHPLRDYLGALLWDGRARVGSWLRDYLSARAIAGGGAEYVDAVGQMWLVSAVARAYQPACQADHVLVLEGVEGAGKSTVAKILGGAHFLDTALDITNKDAYQAIRGRWIVELAELDSLMRAESSAAKSFFSRSTDTYRRPYATDVVSVPRTCVFIGTVNHNDYVKDATGGRRYWPVEVGGIDVAALRRDRDQIWAEARSLYRRGAQWWPSPEQAHLFRAEQAARVVDDPWEGAIVEWLQGRETATPADILRYAIGQPVERQTRQDQTRVGILMQRIGWRRARPVEMGARITRYYAPSDGGET